MNIQKGAAGNRSAPDTTKESPPRFGDSAAGNSYSFITTRINRAAYSSAGRSLNVMGIAPSQGLRIDRLPQDSACPDYSMYFHFYVSNIFLDMGAHCPYNTHV